MSKEYLQALNIIKFNSDDVDGLQYLEAFKVVESALQRLETIDNAKPSEALECLDKVNNYLNDVYDYKEIKEEVRKDINFIKQVLINFDLIKDFLKDLSKLTNETDLNKIMKKLQDQEKVLKIIFEKGLSLVERDMIKQSENYEQYQIKISWWNYKPFAIPKTEEEFDLLKRYFK